MRHFSILCACLALMGCEISTTSGPTTSGPPQETTRSTAAPGQVSLRTFRAVQARLEPVAEAMCRNRTQGVNCDFLIVIEKNPNLPPNAFQTLDKSGRPVIGFTQALIRDARNPDEIAFVMGHEAAHHIEGHIPETQQRAVSGAILGSVLASALGGSAATVDTAQRLGGTVGARSYSKKFELEADALGTVITHRAGYDPVLGAEFFNRIPDPGDRFLGSHPPNAERIATVRRVAAQL